MTNEEAIYLLRNTAWIAPSLEPIDEAIEMACEALRAEQTEPQICDTCRYYNSDIPCGSTPSACKEADTFAEEFVQGMKKLRMVAKTKQSNSEKPNNCETCKFELYCPEMCDGCCKWDSHYEPKNDSQTELVNDSQILVKDLVDDEFNPYDEECMRCKHLKLKCEFVPSYCKYEPRNEQSGKE